MINFNDPETQGLDDREREEELLEMKRVENYKNESRENETDQEK